MSDIGHVRYDERSKLWYVDLPWEGKRQRLFFIPAKDRYIPCETENLGYILKGMINDQIDLKIFRPERFKKKRTLHLREYARNWLKNQKYLMDSTRYAYNYDIEKHIIPIHAEGRPLGDYFLDDITRKVIKDWVSNVPKAKKNARGTLRTILLSAEGDGDMTKCPVFPPLRGKDAPVDPEIIFYDHELVFSIIERIPLEYRHGFLLKAATGCRSAEARAFRKDSIWQSHVVFKCSFDRFEKEVTYKTKRVVAWPKTEAIKAIVEDANGWKYPQPYLFINPNTGRPFTAKWTKYWNAACMEVLGYTIKLNNATRHTFACHLLNEGVDMSVVSRLLGHSSCRVTEKKYATYKTITLKNVVEAKAPIPIERLLGKKKIAEQQNCKEGTND